MHPVEIEKCMKTMTVLYDTREHETPALRRRLNAMPCKHERRCLHSGDYSVCCELLDGSEFSLESKVAIERKMSLDELCGNYTQGRRRFENEFERMKDAGGRMYIVVENADWRKILGGKYRSRFNAKSLTASLLVWCARYNAVPVFCTEYEAPDLIYNILYYELREHLKNYEKEVNPMPSTYIKLDRSILQWRWFKDPNTLQLWIYLLASVNIKDNDFMKVTIHRGELATSYPGLSTATGLTIKQVRTALEHLKDTGEVAVTRHPKFSVISVLNYDLYQGAGQSEGSQTAVRGQSKGTNQRIKEYKNIKNTLSKDSVCDINAHPHGRFQNVFLTDEEYETYKRENPDIDEIIEELSEAIDTDPKRYQEGHPTSWVNKFIRQKRKTTKPPERRKMLT